MAPQNAEERGMAELLVRSLNLEGVEAQSIDPESPLFGHDTAGLGLDSIDALEIALAVQTEFGVELRSDDPQTRSAFASLRALTAHVQAQRTN